MIQHIRDLNVRGWDTLTVVKTTKVNRRKHSKMNSAIAFALTNNRVIQSAVPLYYTILSTYSAKLKSTDMAIDTEYCHASFTRTN